MMILLKMPIEGTHLPVRPLTASRIGLGSDALQSAGHAVLGTLYSRARRIGLDGTSYLLSGLCKSVSLRLFLVAVVRMLS